MSDEFVEIHVNGEPASPDAPPPAAAPAVEEQPKEAAADAPNGEPEDNAGAKPEGEEGEHGEDGEKDEQLRDRNGRFKGGAQGRINELTRLRHDAERRAEALAAEVAQLKGTATRNGAPVGSEAAKPKVDDYEDYGEFVEALTDWKADQRISQNVDKNATAAAQAAAEHRNAEWGAKVDAVAETLPDYAEVAGKSEVQVRDHVVQAIQDADRGPELVYHLAKNPDVATRLNEMTPARAAMELGRIEASLGGKAATPAPQPPKTSNAPPPITPVSQGSATQKDPSNMTMDEYLAHRKAQGIYR